MRTGRQGMEGPEKASYNSPLLPYCEGLHTAGLWHQPVEGDAAKVPATLLCCAVVACAVGQPPDAPACCKPALVGGHAAAGE